MSRVKFGDVVKDVKINIDRLNNPYEYYVAGDHMDSEDLTIHRKGCFTTDDVGPAFIRVFKPGQILYGSRRTYLKKIAVADFEGVCANTTFVFETKDPHAFEQRLLPFIMLSKDFTTWSIAKSKGSTNPYVLFSDLADFEFELPPLEEQKVLVDKLWAAYRLKEAYKKLLVATDEMVKSQFIEMFGNPVTNTKGWKTAKIKDVAPEMPSKEQLSGKIWLLNLDMIESNTGRIIEKVYEDVENALSVQSFDEGNVLFSKLRPYLNKVVIPDEPGMATTELVPLRPEPSKLHKVFLSHLLRGNQFVNYANDIAGGTKMPRMPLTELRNFDCILPPMDKQLEFVFIAEQVDKSKFGDFKSQFIEMFGNPLSLNQKNELKRLGECCILNPRRPNIALCDTDKVSFIPMPAVSEDGYLVDMTDEEYGKVKKGFTYFENNDVLFAKITPCMENGKGAIVHGLTNGIGMGSTEFHVLRPINGISSPYWLLALTRMPIFRERAAKNMSGTGGQKRVSASYLDHFMVGLPAMEEQRRFEAIYRQADKSKSVIQKALVYLNDIQSDELGKIA
jgi:type I restriction enzyme S subunit